jgi:hypothetical protein
MEGHVSFFETDIARQFTDKCPKNADNNKNNPE